MKITKREEILLISAIAKRAKSMGHPDDLLSIDMDISFAHKEHPLRLTDLLSADDLNFSHDVFGIRKHFNRKTLKMEDCFVPRFTDYTN